MECCPWSCPDLIAGPEKGFSWTCLQGDKPHPLLRPHPSSSLVALLAPPNSSGGSDWFHLGPAFLSQSSKSPSQLPTYDWKLGTTSLTDWLVLQKAHIVQCFALLGTKVLQPEADDALALLQGTGREHREQPPTG